MGRGLRYVVARYMPNPTREEYVNIGVLLQSEEGTVCRFTDDFSRVAALDPTVDRRILDDQQSEWSRRLTQSSEVIPVGQEHTPTEVCLADERFLEYLVTSHVHNYRFSEIRHVSGGAIQQTNVSGILDTLFETYVAKKRSPFQTEYRLTYTRRLTVQVFRGLKSIGADKHRSFKRNFQLKGLLPQYEVPFAYENGRLVLIEVAGLRAKDGKEEYHAVHVAGFRAARIKQLCAASEQARPELLAVFTLPDDPKNRELADDMLRTCFDDRFNYEEEPKRFEEKVAADLGLRLEGML